MKAASSSVLKAIAAVRPMDYPTLLAGMGEKDRANLERQLLAYEAKAGESAAQRWRRLACTLRSLAPGRLKIAPASVMQFYIADGKYHQQVFALQALADGGFVVVAPNVLPAAFGAGVVGRPRPGQAGVYPVGRSAESLAIESLDGSTPNLDAYCRDMTGWNRKAIRIALPPAASDAQVKAAEQLCALAATTWRGS